MQTKLMSLSVCPILFLCPDVLSVSKLIKNNKDVQSQFLMCSGDIVKR